MSNTGQTPYDNYKSLLGYLSSSQTVNLANETIELMHQRIIDLEMRIDDKKRGLDRIFKVVSSFNGGLTPIGCDGVIVLKVDEYNSLIQAINTAE